MDCGIHEEDKEFETDREENEMTTTKRMLDDLAAYTATLADGLVYAVDNAATSNVMTDYPDPNRTDLQVVIRSVTLGGFNGGYLNVYDGGAEVAVYGSLDEAYAMIFNLCSEFHKRMAFDYGDHKFLHVWPQEGEPVFGGEIFGENVRYYFTISVKYMKVS
jgi:hypothetical protein